MPCASSTVIRSLEWATSERKRASLFRRWRSSASDAPSTASETCEASDSSESTSSRGIASRRRDDEQRRASRRGRRAAGAERAAGRRRAELARASTRAGCRATAGGRRRDSRSQPGGVLGSGHSPCASSDDASDHRRSSRAGARGGRWRLADQRAGPRRSPRRCTWSRPAAATSSTPALAQRELARGRPLLLADETGHAATTSRKSTADATITTSTSGLSSSCAKRMPGAIRQAPASSARRDGVRRVRDARGRLLERRASTGAARRRPRAGSRRSSRRRRSAGGCTCP